jgi:hypothetical protein
LNSAFVLDLIQNRLNTRARAYLLREGLVDKEFMYNSAGSSVIHIWGRYWPVIDYWRRREQGPNHLENMEYLAKLMWEMSKVRGGISPGFKGGFIFDRYSEVFEPISTSPQ